MHSNKLILIFALMLLSISFISANDLIFKQSEEMDLKVPCFNNNTYCSSLAKCNITILYPDGNILVNNQRMSNKISYHNYTLETDKTITIGDYVTTVICVDGDYNGYSTFKYSITGHGKENPSGIVIVFFSILFLVMIGFFAYIFIYSIGHLVSLDFDLMDLAYNLGMYFVVFGVYALSIFYLGNPTIEGFLILFIQIGAFTHVLIPFVAFILSFIKGGMNKREVYFGKRMPRQNDSLRY